MSEEDKDEVEKPFPVGLALTCCDQGGEIVSYFSDGSWRIDGDFGQPDIEVSLCPFCGMHLASLSHNLGLT